MKNIIDKVKNKFFREGFLKNVMIVIGGTTFAQGLTILCSPLLTHLYTPDQFGLLAVYISVLSFFAVIASLCFDLAIPLPEDERIALSLLKLALLSVAILTLILGVCFLVWDYELTSLLKVPQLQNYIWILPISFLGIGIYQALGAWAIREKHFTIITKTKLNQSISQITVQISTGFMGFGNFGLLLGDMLGRIAGSGVLAMSVFKKHKKTLSSITMKEMKNTAIEYKKFPLILSGSSLLNTLGLQITPVIIVLQYGAYVGGLWALSERVIGVPMALVGRAVSQVFFGEAASVARECPEKLRKMFYTAAWNLLKIGCIPILIVVVLGPWLFETVFGSEWGKSGEYVRILAPMYLMQFITVPLDSALVILQKQKWQLCWDAGRLILITSGLFLVGHLDLSAEKAVITYTVLMFIGYSSLFLLCIKSIEQNVRNGRVPHSTVEGEIEDEQ